MEVFTSDKKELLEIELADDLLLCAVRRAAASRSRVLLSSERVPRYSHDCEGRDGLHVPTYLAELMPAEPVRFYTHLATRGTSYAWPGLTGEAAADAHRSVQAEEVQLGAVQGATREGFGVCDGTGVDGESVQGRFRVGSPTRAGKDLI